MWKSARKLVAASPNTRLTEQGPTITRRMRRPVFVQSLPEQKRNPLPPWDTVAAGSFFYALLGRFAEVDAELVEKLQHAANLFFVWIGFGTVVGLVAKAVMPGRDPGGAIVTVAMGVGGTIIGCGIVSYFLEGHAVTPISPIGFVVGTAGALLILAFYRLLAGYWFIEGEHPRRHYHPRAPRPRTPRRRRSQPSYRDVHL
jgi:uncharacterized membrane protein YeaQ/YmgE (transglycosylase-associated protein family)